jgi:hypothetical protein
MASKEDRTEFLRILYDWSIGKNPEKFYGFYAHLSEHGKKDGLPFLDKDLLFCIDSIRLKVNSMHKFFYLILSSINKT